MSSPKKKSVIVDAVIVEMKHQKKVMDYIVRSDAKGIIVFHNVGSGKCHAKDTPILMNDGSIKKVQNIKTGDLLMGDDSTPRKVLSLARGLDQMYDIIPVKGEKYTVNEEHILCLKASGFPKFQHNNNKYNTSFNIQWIENNKFNSKTFAYKDEKTKIIQEKKARQFYEAIKVDQIIEMSVKEYLKLSKNKKADLKGYRVPVDFPHRNIDLDPYMLGYWLGDGSKRGTCITSQDSAVIKYFKENLGKYNCYLQYKSNYDYNITGDGTNKVGCNHFMNSLKKYNLIKNKHIPHIYKCNSRENRLKLLAGLIDSDGYLDSKGVYELTQSAEKERLIDDIIYLCRSLGFACYKNEKLTSCNYKGIKKNKKAFRIHISGKGIENIPTQIKRKQAKPRKQKKDVLVTGIKIQKVNVDKYYGFMLDGNNRYLLGDFTVTHNTLTSLFSAKEILKKYPDKHVIIATPASLVSNFENTIKTLKLPFKNKIKVESYQKLTNYLKKHGSTICSDAVLIIDESHNFNGGGMMFEAMLDCAGKAFKVILLSATVVKNAPSEISKQLSLVEGKRVSGKIIDKMTSIKDDLKRKRAFNGFFRCKISYHKNTDFTNYPKVIDHAVKLQMSPKYYKEYYKIQEDIRSDLPEFLEDTKNITVFLNGIRRASNKTNVLSPKIKWIAEKIVEDYNKGKKILIYSNWIDTGIVILKQILEAEKIKFSQVIGGLSKKEKDANINKYNSGKTRIMLVSASGSEGLNLKETRTVIIMEPYWNKTRIQQVIGRASRYKSHSNLPEKDRKVDVYHLILEKPPKKQRFDEDNKLESADVIIWNMAEEKQEFIDIFYDTLSKVSIEKDGSCFN